MAVVLAVAATGGVWPSAQADVFTFHHEQVLGTSLEIQVQADSEEVATEAEERVLAEIERLSALFSTYTADSEFSRWQRSARVPVPISQELFDLLTDCERWHARSGGAFDPGVEHLSRLWRAAEQRNLLPTPEAIETARATARQAHWRLDPSALTATRLSDCPLTLNAVAKGTIVEAACRAACASRQVQGLLVNLGGDLRACGTTVQEVRITDPRQDAVNAPSLDRIFVADRAVATSGNYRRGFRIAGRRYSHILDPRTGRPADGIASATVVARSSADADALATLCNILPVQESLALVASLDDVECLLVTDDGRQHRSPHWSELQSPRLFRFAGQLAQAAAQSSARDDSDELHADEPAPGDDKPPAAVSELLELIVKFELNQPESAQYRRPYVAIWLEDAEQQPVRTALLWMQTRQPGPRWHRDMLRWYRTEGVRKRTGGGDLIRTLAGATRGPGEYKTLFDGFDDGGRPLAPGKYTLYIEAVREKGTYQLIRQPLTLGNRPIAETKLKGNIEIKSASFEYRAQAAPPEKDGR